MRSLLLAIASWLLLYPPRVAVGYIYTYSEKFSPDSNNIQVSEGPMFSTHNAPFGSGEAFTAATGHLTAEDLSTNITSMDLIVHVLFVNETGKNLIGLDGPDSSVLLCCPKTATDSKCKGRQAGDVPRPVGLNST